ncbi:hypothetical protein GCM10009757_01810 [Streptomyces cheonanensis]|uniref:Secreted protein n=2 Tax=Streptomyces TaxID=1883 RepID=A0ABP5GCD4_9ACTN
MVNANKNARGQKQASRHGLRAGALTAGTLLMLLMTSPLAQAAHREDGDDPGPGLSAIETLGLFVAAPIALFALITGLVILGDRKKQPSGKQS